MLYVSMWHPSSAGDVDVFGAVCFQSTTNNGELSVSLCYNNHLERLTVGVYEARVFKAAQGAPAGESSSLSPRHPSLHLDVINEVDRASTPQLLAASYKSVSFFPFPVYLLEQLFKS